MPARIPPLQISAYTATSAVGVGKEPLAEALEHSRSGLRANDFGPAPLPTWIGRVDGLEEIRLPEAFAHWDCRNNRLAWLGLQADGFLEAVAEARGRHGAARIALILGTSTSSIGEAELAYTQLDASGAFPTAQRRPKVHTPHSLAMFVQEVLGLEGPSETISTACSSSAKVFASAERLIRLGLVDAAVVGGVDTLCGSVLFGFNSLELVSGGPCRPFDPERDGISLGEAAGFALLERADAASATGLQLLGYGEASDAHHMSTPHPEGLGAERALDEALARAGLAPEAIDYINMHGTASQKNDEVEGALVARMASGGVECIAGVLRDPVFGPVLMFGLGGIHVETLRDVALRVLPVTREDTLAMVRELRAFAILDGARGKAPVDLASIADALCALADFALRAGDSLASAEINPLIARPQAEGGCVAVDALIVGRDPSPAEGGIA
ncbi:acetate--CoA ligase family protein [Variovorax sp. CT11-76]